MFPKTVLIINDDPLQVEILRDHFSRNEAEHVLTAADGRRALNIMSKTAGEIDVILTDIYMPELDGIEFPAELGKHSSSVPVILVSGGSRQQLRPAEQLALIHGLQCIDVMSKPLNLDALDRSLRTTFAEADYFSAVGHAVFSDASLSNGARSHVETDDMWELRAGARLTIGFGGND